MQCNYDIKRVLKFNNGKCGSKTEYYSVDDMIIMGYEDVNDGEIEIRGYIVGIEDDGYLLIYNHKSGRIQKYYLSNITFMIK